MIRLARINWFDWKGASRKTSYRVVKSNIKSMDFILKIRRNKSYLHRRNDFWIEFYYFGYGWVNGNRHNHIVNKKT